MYIQYFLASYQPLRIMKFSLKHAGKWVAIRDNKIIADGKTLNKVMVKVEKEKDKEKLRYTLVPKGYMAG